ncbi:MAG TPA: DNA alkylation repair protein [Longimicrobium sp.]|jgi:3-methyladenine DNA glycosylase AlkD|uniref:DNA alkylation repair protein n=1 Tax=Longimicrobium sp. TaxID=2029185 RepID=UPI002ED99D5E
MKARAPAATVEEIAARLQALGDADDARFLAGYFRTGPGEYGEGDRFLGIRVPVLRRLVRESRGLPLDRVAELLRSPWHEARLLACLLLADAYPRADAAARDDIYRLYLRNTAFINNWDLVDSSAPHVVGAHLVDKDRAVLEHLARSESLWERRIAILATQHFIRRGDFGTTLRIAELLVDDGHDLIHKAVGWMLREVGNRDRAAEEAFLTRHHRTMPRTMLRYAIEKFPPGLRARYLRREPASDQG